MLSLTVIFSTAFIVALSGAMMPGPLLTVTISETARRGGLAALVLVTGHALLELIMVAALAVGLSKILGAQLVVRIIGVIGGLFLLWMGFGAVRDAALRRVSLSEASAGPAGNQGLLIASGAATSLANPYWTLWWATIGAGFLAKSIAQAGAVGIGLFYAGHILGDYAWYGAVGFSVAAGRRVLSDRIYRAVLLVCGAFLIALAVSFIGDFKIL